MKTLKLVGLSVLAMAALSGCAHYSPKDCKTVYEYRPPASQEGRMCVSKCGWRRDQCRDHQQQQYLNCDHHNRMIELERERCLASGATNCYGATTMPCERPCVGGPCADECETEYRFCYQGCGGRIVSKEVCSDDCRGGDCD